jgi:DNA-binding CsgD family transcriptional regulator/PAS domain-containing protein
MLANLAGMNASSRPLDGWTEQAADLPPVEAVSELIGSIYDCALDPGHWDKTLQELGNTFRCFNAMLVNFDLTHGRGAFARIVGVEPHWREQMDQHNAELASWHRLYFGPDWPIDEPQVRSRDVPRAVVEQSRMANEWGEPQGLVDTMALVLLNTPTRYSQLGLGRHRRVGPVTPREIALGRLLSPHVRRAATISDVIDLKTIESSAAGSTLDSLHVGVVITDHRGRVLHANAAAEAMMRAGSPIRSAGGTIQTNVPAATAELRSAVALADSSEAGLGTTGLAVRLTPPGQPPVLAHVLPLKQGEVRSRLQPEAAAAIFIGPVSSGASGAEAMAVAYDLTPMETRVLAGLLSGQRPAETADVLGVAETTVRTHLRSIFAKTGAARQADLVRLSTQMAASVLRVGATGA